MKAAKVRLFIRIRRSGDRYAYVDPAWNRNRTLREGYAIVDGKQEHHPEGVYYLRYKRGSKRVRDAVGQRADLASVALRNVEHGLESIALGQTIPQVLPDQVQSAGPLDTTVTLTEAVSAYLQEVRAFRAPKTIASCEYILGLFLERLPGKLVTHVSRRDLLDHMIALKNRGLGHRTIYNHVARINTLLKASGRPNLLKPADWPKYDEKDVTAYNTEEISTLFAAASAAERLLFEFLLGTGFREQEVTYCTWANVDFKSKTVSVWSKPEMGFRVKDKEERSVPIPDTLMNALLSLKRQSTSMLLFPSASGKPDGHYLRKLQRLAHRAGLNCGECVSNSGKECSDGPTCSGWGLHKFRRTFATFHSEAGVSPRQIQLWLGHADLATTLRYLAAADLRSERTRAQVNASFAPVILGGAA